MRLLPILIFLCCVCPLAFGLQCHSCTYLEGKLEGAEETKVIMGDEKCRDNATTFTLKNCETEADAENSRTIVSAKWISPSAKFTLGCLKAMINTEGTDIIFRGCYGLPDEQFGSYYGKCDSADPRLWEKVNVGSLQGDMKEALHISQSKLDICFCGDADGCNSAKTLRSNIHLGIILIGCFFVSSTQIWTFFSL